MLYINTHRHAYMAELFQLEIQSKFPVQRCVEGEATFKILTVCFLSFKSLSNRLFTFLMPLILDLNAVSIYEFKHLVLKGLDLQHAVISFDFAFIFLASTSDFQVLTILISAVFLKLNNNSSYLSE